MKSSQRECVPGTSVQKRALQLCDTAEMTSGLFNKVTSEIGPKDNATILRYTWQERFLLCLLPLLNSRSKTRILMTSWQCLAQKQSKQTKNTSLICKPPPPPLLLLMESAAERGSQIHKSQTRLNASSLASQSLSVLLSSFPE